MIRGYERHLAVEKVLNTESYRLKTPMDFEFEPESKIKLGFYIIIA